MKGVPGSSRDQIVGWLGDSLQGKVTTPPERGRANEAVVSLLAEQLELPADAVAVASGHSSPANVIAINGIDAEAIKTALGCGRRPMASPSVPGPANARGCSPPFAVPKAVWPSLNCPRNGPVTSLSSPSAQTFPESGHRTAGRACPHTRMNVDRGRHEDAVGHARMQMHVVVERRAQASSAGDQRKLCRVAY